MPRQWPPGSDVVARVKYLSLLMLVVWLGLIIPTCAESDEFTDKQLEQGQLLCQHRQKMAESVQFVRVVQRNDFDDFSRVLEVLTNRGGPLGEFVSPDQIQVKDAYFNELLNIAFEVYSYFDIGIAPDKVGESFLEVCRVEFEDNKPPHLRGEFNV